MGMDRVFWFSAFVISYTYLGYPLLLAMWARIGTRLVRKADGPSLQQWPHLSIILAARNEGARLPARLDNLLQLNYPGDREIIVVSDGSTDHTGDVLRRYQGRVRIVEVDGGGKPLALNAGVSMASGDILMFADARQSFSRNALVEMVANFADPHVGGVTGELVLDSEHGNSDSTIGDGVGLYWTYEKWLRRKESAIWSTLGATGAIYAIRRSLWQPLPAETLLDDVLVPMRVVLAGQRIVFEERAVAYDRTSADAANETRRKTRTLAGNYQILAQEPRLLIPGVNPVWLQYMSHKVGRLLVPWALIGAFVSSAVLSRSHWFFMVTFAAQLAFYALAVIGGALDARDRRASSTTVGAIGEREGATSWSH
jgi:cellulose synthase/poly-beta-1,6-N-acetylglucosamine synthase-like glycosyltransferase